MFSQAKKFTLTLLNLTLHVGRCLLFLQATQALRVSRGIALLFLGFRHPRWQWGVSPTPRPPLPPGKTRYPLYRRLGGSQDRSERAKNLVPTGIRSRTVQPVVSRRYTYTALLFHRSEILDEEFNSRSIFRKKRVVYVTVSRYRKLDTYGQSDKT